MGKINSRGRFVAEVVKSIETSDGQDEAFIFGISGKWGEGKTTFLKSLKEKLEACESTKMRVVELRPWKYAYADDDSLLRELLRQMLRLHTNPLRRWWLSRQLDGLYHDVSKKQINWSVTLAAAVTLAGLGLLYKYPPALLHDVATFIQENKALVTLLLIPVLLGVANAVTTSQSSTKAVSTRDKFDGLLSQLLEKLSIDKVVVYVDDLDRLTASKAVAVLDSLRTFFDKQTLVFIVASDHSVLERHLGNELKPSADLPEQMEEGRRFLKKIFNVYWRLPLPTKPEYETYVKSLTGKAGNRFLHDKLINDSYRKTFRQYLLTYFSNNFRNAERFVSRVEFTLRLIEAQSSETTTTKVNKEYFAEMLSNPLLVIRVLLIEELANPLFERIQHKPELLLTLEQQATTSQEYGKELDDLSQEQQTFITSFLPEKPRFRDETGVRVMSIQPYISLSSDSSFGDIRGLSPAEFSQHLRDDRIADLINILASSGEQKLTDAANAFSDDFARIADSNAPQKAKLLSNLIDVATGSDPKLPAQSIITNSIVNYGFGFAGNLEPVERIGLLEEIGSLKLDDSQFSVVLENTPEFIAADWAQITDLNDGRQLSPLVQQKFLRYFAQYFPAFKNDAMTQLGPYLDRFSAKAVNSAFTSILPDLITYFIDSNNDTLREYTLTILRKTNDGLSQLRDQLRTQVNARNTALFNWLAGYAKTTTEPLLTTDELIDAVLFGQTPVTSVSGLTESLALFQSLPEVKDKLWVGLLKLDATLLVDALFEVVLIDNYLPISPTSETANRILELILRRFVNRESAGLPQTLNWLNRITPERWVFANLRLEKQLIKLIDDRLGTQYPSDDVRSGLKRIKNDFGSTTQ